MKSSNLNPFMVGVFFLLLSCGKKETAPNEVGLKLGEGATKPVKSQKTIALNGAGATFPYPLYSKWMTEYGRIKPLVRLNYQSIGSSAGIHQIIAGTVDFGATDAPMSEQEKGQAPRTILHIPTAIGSVVITYNLNGLSKPLRLTPAVLADICLGKIERWDNTLLTGLNPDAQLPAQPIAVVHRSDGSGTTAVFTDYLVKVSSAFKDAVGQGKTVNWPTGLGAEGSDGVTAQIKTTPNALGYVEYAYAKQNQMPMAELQNRAGRFVGPSLAATTSAAARIELPESLHVSLTDPTGENAYPVSAYTYLLIYQDLIDPIKGQALAEFIWWAVHDGQRHASPLGYAPLPLKVVSAVEDRLRQLRAGDRRLL